MAGVSKGDLRFIFGPPVHPRFRGLAPAPKRLQLNHGPTLYVGRLVDDGHEIILAPAPLELAIARLAEALRRTGP